MSPATASRPQRGCGQSHIGARPFPIGGTVRHGVSASFTATKGCSVDRHWVRVGVRAASVGLLLVGVLGGVYLGRDRGARQPGADAQSLVRTDADEAQLLASRESEHAAARAQQRAAESDAAAKAATEAKAAASKARALAKEAIAEKAAAEKAAKDAKAKKKAQSSGALVPYTGPIPDSCNDFTGNRATGCALMLGAGFKIDQFPCLNKLWNKESGWNARAANAGSGAYGIPQALPGSKMGSAGADWKTNPATQIKWGLGYIKGRYKTPCAAWSRSESTGSY
jgi:hypothetical protein